MQRLRNVALGALMVLAAFLTVLLSEMLVGVWLAVAPFDVTGSLFVRAVFPVHLISVGLGFLLLFRLMRRSQWVYPAIYAVAALVIYVLMLRAFANPWDDVLRYLYSMTLAMGLWRFLFRHRLQGAPSPESQA